MTSATQTTQAASPSRLLSALDQPATAIAIASFGLALRIAFLFVIHRQAFLSDAASYTRMAALLAHRQAFIPFWPPGIPLYLALIQHIFGASSILTRVAILPFYLGLCFVLYRFTQQLTGSCTAAAISLIPLALAPEMIFFSLEPTTELASAFFLTLTALTLLRLGLAFTFRQLLLLSLALGSLALLRPASLMLLAAVPLYLLLKQQGIVRALAPVVLPLVMVLLWVVHVQHTTGRFVWINTANAKNLYIGNNPNTPLYRTWWLGSHHAREDAALPVHPSDPIELEREYSRVAKNYILAHPALFLLRTFNRACVFFAPNTFPGAYLIESYSFPRLFGFAVIALDALIFLAAALGFLCFLCTEPRYRGILAGLIALYAAPYCIAFSHPRYHFPIEPLLYAAAAAFLLRFRTHPSSTLNRLLRHRTVILTAAAVLLLIQLEFLVIILRTQA